MMDSPPPSETQRVKVYHRNEAGKWDEQGTGNLTIDFLENSDDLGLIVTDEEDNENLLVHRISSDDIYRKQEDTISWIDADFASELALKFQENTGCSSIWDSICGAQRNIHFTSLSDEAVHNANSKLRVFPDVELSTLPLLLKTVVEILFLPISGRMRLSKLISIDQDFFRKLMDLFRICEDLDNIDGLHMIHQIVRGIITLNNRPIIEKIFEDELFMDIVGSLEYEPDVVHVHHRTFLKEQVKFKEAIPITDPLVLSKIHQTYRIVYLKDVILPRYLNIQTVTTLNSIIDSNNAMVVSFLKDDSIFIQELFARLKSSTTSADSKKKLVSCLQEFCNRSKSLEITQNLQFLRVLVNEGIFDILAEVLQSHDKKLVLAGTDILTFFLNQDPDLLHTYVTRQEGVSLLEFLVKGILTDFRDDMHCQFLESLQMLLGSNTSVQRDIVIEIFYEKHLVEIIDVITSACPTTGAMQGVVKPEILMNICELLKFCVLQHPYRIIKWNFLLNGVVDKVLLLTRRKETYLVTAVVRFVRALISSENEHLMNHIVKNNILKPIIDAFVRNGDRYNLLHSTILELFEYIRTENLMTLLKYIVETYWDQLVIFEKLPSIKSFKVRYEQITEMKNAPPLLDIRRWIDEHAPEKKEEDHFNEQRIMNSGKEDSPSASTPRNTNLRAQPTLSDVSPASYPLPRFGPFGRLVDYEDDEDDEDYITPPRKHSTTSNKGGEQPDPVSKRKLLDSNEEPVLHDNEDHMPSPNKKRLIGSSEEGEPVVLERNKAKRELLCPIEKTPPRKQSAMSDDEEAGKLASPKRKQLVSNEETELLKRQRLFSTLSKSNEDLFASLCSILSQTVLSPTITSGAQDDVSDTAQDDVSDTADSKNSNRGGEDHEEKGSESESDKPVTGSNDGNQEGSRDKASSRSCLESTQAPNDRQPGGEDCPFFASLCSTLSQAVLSTTITSGAQDDVSDSADSKNSNGGEEDHKERGSESEPDKPVNGSNNLH